MARICKLTEEQYNYIKECGAKLNEGDFTQEFDSSKGGSVISAAKDAESERRAKNVPNNVPTKLVDKNPQNSSKIHTKSQIIENRLNNMKKNSKVYTVKDFMKNIGL